MQKITPHLWFDSEAEEAVKLYTSLFPQSSIGKTTHYTEAGFEIHKQTAGKVMTIDFELAGQKFIALNGGPFFKFTPATSFSIACETAEEVNAYWAQLSEGGKALMELGSYPFSDRYGWTNDRFGLSWQVMLVKNLPIKQKITPTFLFVGDKCGKTKEAIIFYTAIFPNSGIDYMTPYGHNPGPDKPDFIMHAGFSLAGHKFAAMDSAMQHKFTFNEAVSFLVECKDQSEIDFYWDKLTIGGDLNAQQCGWLKDQFGISWQINPTVLHQMLDDADPAAEERVTNAFLKMKRFDIAELQRVYQNQ